MEYAARKVKLKPLNSVSVLYVLLLLLLLLLLRNYLTRWCIVLEKIFSLLVEKFVTFYGT
jgi:hypothetical protein